MTTRSTRGEKTVRNYGYFLNKFNKRFGSQNIEKITSNDILSFLSEQTDGQKQATKRFKYTTLKSLFNFIRLMDDQLQVNPCDTATLRKTFRSARGQQWTILEKDTVDEIIFKTDDPRNRLMLELMARGGMRIGEVLNLRVEDVDERRLLIKNPKSGRQSEVVFIPQKVADRLKDYIRAQGVRPEQRVFPLGYTGANLAVKKAGRRIGIELRPHDLHNFKGGPPPQFARHHPEVSW